MALIHRVRELRIERAHAQFLEQEDHKQDVHAECAAHDQCTARGISPPAKNTHLIQGRQFDGPIENTARIKVHMIRSADDQQQTGGEQGGEDDAHGSTTIDHSELAHPLGKNRGKNTGDGGTDEHREAGAAGGDKEGHRQSGQHSVADCVSHHAHAAQDEEAAGQRTGHRAERTDDHDPGVEHRPVHAVPSESVMTCGLLGKFRSCSCPPSSLSS